MTNNIRAMFGAKQLKASSRINDNLEPKLFQGFTQQRDKGVVGGIGVESTQNTGEILTSRGR